MTNLKKLQSHVVSLKKSTEHFDYTVKNLLIVISSEALIVEEIVSSEVNQ